MEKKISNKQTQRSYPQKYRSFRLGSNNSTLRRLHRCCKRLLFTFCTKQYSKQTNIKGVFMNPGVKCLRAVAACYNHTKNQDILHIFLTQLKQFHEAVFTYSQLRSRQNSPGLPHSKIKILVFTRYSQYFPFFKVQKQECLPALCRTTSDLVCI